MNEHYKTGVDINFCRLNDKLAANVPQVKEFILYLSGTAIRLTAVAEGFSQRSGTRNVDARQNLSR